MLQEPVRLVQCLPGSLQVLEDSGQENRVGTSVRERNVVGSRNHVDVLQTVQGLSVVDPDVLVDVRREIPVQGFSPQPMSTRVPAAYVSAA